MVEIGIDTQAGKNDGILLPFSQVFVSVCLCDIVERSRSFEMDSLCVLTQLGGIIHLSEDSQILHIRPDSSIPQALVHHHNGCHRFQKFRCSKFKFINSLTKPCQPPSSWIRAVLSRQLHLLASHIASLNCLNMFLNM